VRYLSFGVYGGMGRGHWDRNSGGRARMEAGRSFGGAAVSIEDIG
jgi:hypothetical protein